MKTFQYNGPTDSSATLRLADSSELDVIFRRGSTVTVPEDHDYIQTLIALEHLTPVTESEPAAEQVTELATPSKASKTTKEGSA